MSILNSPFQLGNLRLRNRLVMPPMATPKEQDLGLVSEELCAYYRDKSRRLGLVIIEHAYVNPIGKAHKGQLSIADDKALPGLRRLTASIHQNGCPVFAQISHAGGRTSAEITGHEAIAPSAIMMPRSKPDFPLPRAMTGTEIDQLIRDFAAAALRAKHSGFDGVEVHSAHSYLLNQFFSPLSNHREDEYTGRSLAGRIRLHLQIVRAVREAVGPDFPIAMRLACNDFMPGGIETEDAVGASQAFEQAGIDLMDVSGGFHGYLHPDESREGYFSALSGAVRAAVRIPVILTGGVKTGQGAEAVLAAGAADLIGVGRALLKDSRWPETALAAAEEAGGGEG